MEVCVVGPGSSLPLVCDDKRGEKEEGVEIERRERRMCKSGVECHLFERKVGMCERERGVPLFLLYQYIVSFLFFKCLIRRCLGYSGMRRDR